MSDSTLIAPWYVAGLAFTCRQCGDCCAGAPGYVWVSPPEIRAVAERLGTSAAQFEQHHTRRIGLRQSLLELANGDCKFLVRGPDGKARCAIHAARPTQCRTWPFWKSNLASQPAWEAAARHCPGMNRGEHYPSAVIQEALRRNAAADLPL